MITHYSIQWYNRPISQITREPQSPPLRKADQIRLMQVYVGDFEKYYNSLMEFRQMAKNTKNNAQFRFTTQFAAIRLSAEDKVSFQTWLAENGDDYGNFVVIAQNDGWKVGSRWDGVNDCFIHSFTMTDEDDRNANICVTSRSDNYFEAFFLNYYKAYVMYDRKRLPTEAAKDNWG
jgi:hypothetical protein